MDDALGQLVRRCCGIQETRPQVIYHSSPRNGLAQLPSSLFGSSTSQRSVSESLSWHYKIQGPMISSPKSLIQSYSPWNDYPLRKHMIASFDFEELSRYVQMMSTALIGWSAGCWHVSVLSCPPIAAQGPANEAGRGEPHLKLWRSIPEAQFL